MLSQTAKKIGQKTSGLSLHGWNLERWGKSILFLCLAIMLGRASIEHAVSPFAFAYFVALTELFGVKRSWPAWLAVVGAWLQGGLGAAMILLVEMLIYRIVRKTCFRGKAPDIHWTPFLAALIDIAIRLAAVGTVWSAYDVLIAFASGALTAILTLIFIQCLPLFSGPANNRNLRPEQLISVTIFLASSITGLNGIVVDHVSLVQIAVDYTVLVMACAGGVGVSTTTAMVVGILGLIDHAQSLSSVAILGFSGLLAGILKDAGRLWVCLGFFVASTVLTASLSMDWQMVYLSTAATLIAMLLCMVTPRRLRQELATYVPGTVEHSESELQRVRRVRSLLSERIDEMGQVFEELSTAFADTGENQLMSAQQLLDYTVGSAAKNICSACPRRTKCWDNEGVATYQAIVQTVAKLESSTGGYVSPTKELKDRCIRLDAMMGVLRHNMEITDRDAKWIAKIHEQRTLVAAQLGGVADVIRSIHKEIDNGNEASVNEETQIHTAFERLGLYVDHVHIVSLDKGRVEVEVTQPSAGAYENSVRMIAPLLSGIVGENISVSHVSTDSPGPCTSTFTSSRLYNVETAVATVARDGRLVSGDTYTSVDLGNGRHAVAVSDGMGNGERARRASSAAIELLKKLLKAGFDEQLAIKTVNSTLLLRSREEMFTTLDMALIDLFSAKAEFLKIGSAPSFLKRSGGVHAITGANVPIGILQDIEVQSIEQQLTDGDILILMSDGIYDAPQHAYDKEDWLKRQIEQLQTDNPQEIADTLIEAAVRMNQGQINDDMTCLVTVVSKYQPEWASIKLPGIVGLRHQPERKRRGA